MLTLAAILLSACRPDDGAESGDTGPDPCANVPVVTWASFGDPFFEAQCRACHSVDAADRQDAPYEMNFDTPDEVRTYTNAIRRSVIEMGTMPVAGPVSDADKEQLGHLLDCGLE